MWGNRMLIYDYIFAREPGKLMHLLMDKKNHSESYYRWRDSAKARLLSTPCEEFSLNGWKGYYFQAGKTPSKTIAFIVHGYRSEHAETAGIWLDTYRKRGIDIFCPDNPAAGNSVGDHIGYGVSESAAVISWIEFLLAHFGKEIRIFLHGFSLGGATVMSLSDRCPENVKFIIDDCGFTSARELLAPRLGILYNPLCLLNRKKTGVDLKETDVRPHLRRSSLPLLFVHGRKDPTVPFRMGLELYMNYRGEKDCLFLDDARHMECYYTDPKAYDAKIDKFLKNYC